MYARANDDDFELAHQRAIGIAQHYKEKEIILNRRLTQDDLVNQPATRAEWAEALGRRKVSKANTRRSSRSRSPVRQPRNAPTQNNRNQSAPGNPPQQSQSHTGNNQQSQNPSSNGNNRKNQQRQGSNHGNTRNGQPDYQRPGPSNASASSSSTSQQGGSNNRKAPKQPKSGQQSANNRPLDLNAEEQALITMMRAAKNNNR